MRDLFLTNASEVTFLEKIKASLERCTSFQFSVSFIKDAGLVLLEKDILRALQRGAEGRIITTTYQNFTDIASLNKFLSWQEKYPNFHCHFDYDIYTDGGFHCKGYLFKYPLSQEVIIGSSNITRFALLKNVEWDISLEDSHEFAAYQAAEEEFEGLWNNTFELSQELIDAYQKQLATAIDRWDMDYISRYNDSLPKPNYMQRLALKEIRRYRDMGAKKALVVAATGSGKTFLAAFDAYNFDAKRLLYVVHRENILLKSIDTFKSIFRDKRTYGLYTGTKQDDGADFLFATNTELSRHLEDFDPHDFDYIILDECHHATADTYQKIIEYFKPTFLLGLTATPDRMDNQDVLSLFDHNIPYQLSLADAMKNDLIVGFKYFAIYDDRIDYSLDKTNTQEMVRQIVSPENVEFISDQIKAHLPPNGKLKAIGFCRNVSHAMQMAEKMNNLGYHATYLTGADPTGMRDKAFQDLSDENNPLEIIFTVDILNEGIDIPAINMVLFLRPTESSVIFIQQLGRGLRKYEGKEYLTVLDFIGNCYQRSVQIALALSSLKPNTVIEKPELCAMVQKDFSQLDLPVEIHFDERAKEEILANIENTNFNRSDYLISDYKKFKEYIHCETYPSHMDYLNNEFAPDLMRFINSKIKGKKNECYYNFLSQIGEPSVPDFNAEEVSLLCALSSILPLVRPDDYAILLSLLDGDKSIEELKDFDSEYGCFKEKQFEHALKYVMGGFKSTKALWNVTERNGKYHFETSRYSAPFLAHLRDLLTYGLERFKGEFSFFPEDFKLYRSYSTAQVMMILNASYFQFMKGTLIQGEHGVLFVGLKKDESLDERLKYKDKFLSPSLFQWESETSCTFHNEKGRKVLGMKKVSLFIRKVKVEDGITLPFTYVGEGTMTNPRETDNEGKTLLFDIRLDHPIEPLYRSDLLVPEEKEKK